MLTREQIRKIELGIFDPPQCRDNAARRLLRTDVARIYELHDQGFDAPTIAERVGIKPSSVNYRIANRNKPRVRGKKEQKGAK